MAGTVSHDHTTQSLKKVHIIISVLHYVHREMGKFLIHPLLVLESTHFPSDYYGNKCCITQCSSVPNSAYIPIQ